MAQTRRSVLRCGVDRLVDQAGAQAGVNGTFFADASVQATDNVLIGPSLCGNEARAVFNRADNAGALPVRPLVLLSPGRTRIPPYDPQAMVDQSALAVRLPGLTDAFLGEVWLVHEDIAADRPRLDGFHVHDAEDPRRRAFFALIPDGWLVLGATTYVATSAQLARALPAANVREAVLLDSGFSTSLVAEPWPARLPRKGALALIDTPFPPREGSALALQAASAAPVGSQPMHLPHLLQQRRNVRLPRHRGRRAERVLHVRVAEPDAQGAKHAPA